VEGSWPVEWRDVAGQSDSFVIVTSEQAEALQTELRGVLAKYRRVGQADPGARRLAAYTVLVPMDLDKPPAS